MHVRPASPHDHEGRRELTSESKTHPGYDRDPWVDPGWIGRGLGSRLFRLAGEGTRELGAERLEWGAEPNAVGFHERIGGRKLHDHVTGWGRGVPGSGLEL